MSYRRQTCTTPINHHWRLLRYTWHDGETCKTTFLPQAHLQAIPCLLHKRHPTHPRERPQNVHLPRGICHAPMLHSAKPTSPPTGADTAPTARKHPRPPHMYLRGEFTNCWRRRIGALSGAAQSIRVWKHACEAHCVSWMWLAPANLHRIPEPM